MITPQADDLLEFDGPLFLDDYDDEKGDFPAPSVVDRVARPLHPGTLLRDLYLPRTGLNLTELAERINVSRRSVSMVVNGSRPITVDMANRLGRAFDTTPQFWLNLQSDVDVWDAMHNHASEYEQIVPLLKGE